MKTVGIVGRQNSGKTHLVTRLIGEFRRRGLTVSTIKHTHHHDIDLDTPGKDSYRHREAGAQEVIVAGERRWFLVHSADPQAPFPLDALIARLAPCDLVLVEGYKGFQSLPRIEVYRPAAAGPEAPLAWTDPTIVAVACPQPATLPGWPRTAARLELDATVAIADFIAAL